MSLARLTAVCLEAFASVAAICACGASSDPAVLDSDSAGAAANQVAVSPGPGTPDASPSTQISFLGAAGTKVADVTVVGSRSGHHAGVLRAYSTGTGESFIPTHPFIAGERVTVHARVGTGTPTQPASTTFTVAHQASVSQQEFPDEPGDPHAIQHYSSAPSLTPSTVTIITPAKPGASPGDFFLAPYQGKGTPGPMIVEQNGSLVWFKPLPAGQAATNFGVQQYDGKPALVWWQGRIIQAGFGEGEDFVYDSSYQRIAVIKAGNGYRADLHVVRLTPQGTAWIDEFDPIHMNLSAEHGSADGVINDSIVQEIDVKTGLVMWEWHALGHIPIGESNNPVPAHGSPWDYVHVNSIDPDTAGDVLISARNTWALYDLDMQTGAIRWRLGGKRSSFKLGSGVRFYWQHDAEFQPGGLISVFDNGSDPPKEPQSRGLLLRPDSANHTVSLVKQFVNPRAKLLASSQGDTLSLTGGNWLLGYGGLPNFTEFDSAGHVLFDATLGKDVQDFRTYLSPWSGQPTSPPSVAVHPSGGTLQVAVSWNGATGVSSWRVLAGASPGALAPVTSAAKAGFQTTIAAASPGPYVQVQALDQSGAVISASAVVKG